MHVYQVIRTASKRAGMSLIEIGPKLGHGKAYVSSMITTGRTPKVDTLARILGACGNAVLLIEQHILLRLRIQLADLGDRFLQCFETEHFLLLGFFELIECSCAGLQGMELFLIFLQQRQIIAEAIQYIKMPFRPQQNLIVMLSVDIDE